MVTTDLMSVVITHSHIEVPITQAILACKRRSKAGKMVPLPVMTVEVPNHLFAGR